MWVLVIIALFSLVTSLILSIVYFRCVRTSDIILVSRVCLPAVNSMSSSSSGKGSDRIPVGSDDGGLSSYITSDEFSGDADADEVMKDTSESDELLTSNTSSEEGDKENTEPVAAVVAPRSRSAERVAGRRVSKPTPGKTKAARRILARIARRKSDRNIRKVSPGSSGEGSTDSSESTSNSDSGSDNSDSDSSALSSDSPSTNKRVKRTKFVRRAAGPARSNSRARAASVDRTKYDALKSEARALRQEVEELKQAATVDGDSLSVAATKLQNAVGRSSRAMDLSKCANKPAVFKGKDDSGSVRDWMAAVLHYMHTAGVPSAMRVAVAVSFLAHDVQRFWFSKSRVLKKEGKKVKEWKVFQRAMYDRYDHSEPEIVARYKLDKLACRHPGSSNVDAYVKQFEQLCTFIPKLSTGERIHRFITGLPVRLADRVRVDPVSCRRWTKFSDLVRYTLNQSTDDTLFANAYNAPGALANVANEIAVNAGMRQSRVQQRRQGGGNGGGGGGKRSYAQALRGQGSGSSGAARRMVEVRNKAGETAQRQKDILNYCFEHRLCHWCYGSGHRASECTQSFKQGYPPNFGAGPSGHGGNGGKHGGGGPGSGPHGRPVKK